MDVELGKLLGEGSFGKVYSVKGQPKSVVKIIGGVSDPSQLRSAFKEAVLGKSIRQDYIMPFSHVGYKKGSKEVRIVMPRGEPLPDRLKREMTFDQLVEKMKEMVCAVSQMHKLHLLHLDIKPMNMIVAENRALLSDLGFVSPKGSYLPFYGTPLYFDPQDVKFPTMTQDLFSLVITLMEMTLNHVYPRHMVTPVDITKNTKEVEWIIEPTNLLSKPVPVRMQNLPKSHQNLLALLQYFFGLWAKGTPFTADDLLQSLNTVYPIPFSCREAKIVSENLKRAISNFEKLPPLNKSMQKFEEMLPGYFLKNNNKELQKFAKQIPKHNKEPSIAQIMKQLFSSV